MRPVFKILADQEDITGILTTRLVSISITDETGLVSDKAEVLLDDRDDTLEIPSRGTELAISLGYEDRGLFEMGIYVVDEVTCFGMPQQMRITAKASNTKIKSVLSAMTAPKSRSWHKHTLIGIVKKIAKEHRFQDALIDGAFDKIYLGHIDQSNESDIAFLQRIAQDHGAFVKPAGGFLIFSRKKRARTLTGDPMPLIKLEREDISDFSMSLAERGKYGKVIAKWHNFKTGKEEKVSAGNTEPAFSMRHTYATKSRAEKAAEAKLEDAQNGMQKLDLTTIGNPEISAESRILINRLSHKTDGEWIATSLSHQFSLSGYTSQINCEKPVQ
ncbi:MAG: phage late control D family protein [Alphaproteobacteria bacterium]